ncbi:hypothetical protein BDN72DRAFT_899121 [Pluteus cervinus]|uniref:Uncharacterized protein n=1 Tax=Pluteus cervinus TaxID=181527 RepID=A0ACD3AQQ1_9AGAR|nr:hypothetical protein BDN72DRAFT_899121 [Pluteus cervinus]
MSNQGQPANSIPFSDSDSDHEESSNGGLPVLPQVETGDKPHSRFFLPDDFIILKVEATLFRVPGFILKDHSTKLREFLAAQPATTLKPEAPITLEDIRAVDFEHFLSVLLPRFVPSFIFGS